MENNSKVDFKSPIGLALSSVCLKEFYNLYDTEGVGIITNTKSGALLFDLMKFVEQDIEIDSDTKKIIWKDCVDDYNIIYDKTIEDKEKHKKLREELYKSRLIEYWLNKVAEDGRMVTLQNEVCYSDGSVKLEEIPVPKLNAQYHTFRLFRED